MPKARRGPSQRPKRDSDRPAAQPPSRIEDPSAALDEVHRFLDTPLAELQDEDIERAAARQLSREAAAAPAMVSLRELLEVVGTGCPATQAGYLKAPDAIALARRLGAPTAALDRARRMDDLPEAARLFHWATAAGLLARRGTKIVPGPYADVLERDPLAAWLRVAITLLEFGPLDGFRQGWRKIYVELLDSGVPGLLVELAAAGGAVPLTEIEDHAWKSVASAYGYDVGNAAERAFAVRLIDGLVDELDALGVLGAQDGDLVLTGLGGLLAAGIALEFGDDLDELDPTAAGAD